MYRNRPMPAATSPRHNKSHDRIGRALLSRGVRRAWWLAVVPKWGRSPAGGVDRPRPNNRSSCLSDLVTIEAVTRKGNCPPRHIHRNEDESFYILEGEITALIGDQTIRGTPGTLVSVRAASHTPLRSIPIRYAC